MTPSRPAGVSTTVTPRPGLEARKLNGRMMRDLLVQIAVDLPLLPDVVAGGDDVHARPEQGFRVSGLDAPAVGGVLSVGHDGVGTVLGAKPGQLPDE